MGCKTDTWRAAEALLPTCRLPRGFADLKKPARGLGFRVLKALRLVDLVGSIRPGYACGRLGADLLEVRRG